MRWLLDVRKLRWLAASCASPAVSSDFIGVSAGLGEPCSSGVPPTVPPSAALVHESCEWAIRVDTEIAEAPLAVTAHAAPPAGKLRGVDYTVDYIHTSSFYGSRAPLM